MRVVAGVARGRSLQAPAGRVTRPTSDRVREAMFDILQSQLDFDGATVVDLFAGSGALGIEALSRGAASTTFVESDGLALDALQANLDGLGFAGPGATVVRADAPRWATNSALHPHSVDVVFADPPYAFASWVSLLESMAPWTGLAILETGADLAVPDGWVVVRQRRYGATVVTVARPAPRPEGLLDAKGGM